MTQLSYPNSAFLVCDRIGRIWATRQLCLLWILGIGIFLGANGSLAAIYAGRFIAGLGVGQTVVVGPVYLAEIVSIPSHTVPVQADRRGWAPASIRGLCTCVFTGFVYLGIVLAYFTNYGCQVNLGDNTHKRWVSEATTAGISVAAEQSCRKCQPVCTSSSPA